MNQKSTKQDKEVIEFGMKKAKPKTFSPEEYEAYPHHLDNPKHQQEEPLDESIKKVFKSKKGKWLIWGLIIGMILMMLIKGVGYFLR